MKKVIVFSILSLAAGSSAFAQAGLDAALTTQYKKNKEKTDAKIQDPKANTKPATWVERAKVYEEISLLNDTTLMDPSAAEKALEAYKKIVELDVDPKKGGLKKDGKNAEVILAGETETDLYKSFLNLGIMKFQTKNYKGALSDFTNAQTYYKKDTTAALYGGIAAQQVDDKDATVASYTKFLKNGGKDPAVIYALSQVHRANNNVDKALEVLRAGLVVNPGHKDLQSEVVNVLLTSGKEDEAVKELTALVDSDPNNVTNVVNLGILYDNSYITHTRNVNKIEEELSKFGAGQDKIEQQIDTEKSKIEVFQGEVKRLAGRIKTQPKNADLKRQLEEVKASETKAKENIAKYEGELAALKESAKGSDKAGLEKQLAEAKSKQADAKAKGLNAYEKAIKIDANNYDAQFGLGAIYYNEGVEIKREVDGMSMADYQAKGKEVEAKLCGRFKKSRPYFEKAVAIKADSDAKSTLDNVNNIIQQLEGKNIPCVE